MFASYLPPSVFYASSEQNGIIIHPYERLRAKREKEEMRWLSIGKLFPYNNRAKNLANGVSFCWAAAAVIYTPLDPRGS